MEVRTDATMTGEEPTGLLRWRERLPSEGAPGRELQQQFRTTHYHMHQISGVTYEWRDVPMRDET